jgi:hypothetical protein
MNSKNTSQKPAGKAISTADYIRGIKAANIDIGESLQKSLNPDTITVKGGKASGRFTKARGFFSYLMASPCVKAEMNRLLGPVHSPIPAVPVGTFVAHDIFGFGYTAGPVLEGGHAGHKVDIAFEDDIEFDADGVVIDEPIRRILLSFLEFDDVSADEEIDEKNRLIAERVGQPIEVALPELDDVVEPDFTEGEETGDDWIDESDDADKDDDSSAPEFVQVELSELS